MEEETMFEKNNNIKITITKDYKKRTKKIDLDIFGNHFDGSGITKYEILNCDVFNNKLIVEFHSPNIEQKIIEVKNDDAEDNLKQKLTENDLKILEEERYYWLH